MSLILDALNKADNEENQTEVPSYASDHDFGPESSLPTNENRRFIIILILCAVFATVITLVLMMFLSNDKETTQQAAPATAEQVQQQQVNQTQPSAASKPQKSTMTNAEKWQQPGPAAGPSESKTSINKPTKLTKIKAPTVSPKPIQYPDVKTSAQTPPQATGTVGNQTQTSDAQLKKAEEERKAQIAAQYEKLQEDIQASTQNAGPNPSPTNNTKSQPENDAISAIYQSAEKENNTAKIASQASGENREGIESNQAAPVITTRNTPKPKPAVKAPPKVDNSLAKYPNLNFIHDLPFSSQNKIPTIMYTAHEYTNRSASVTLNKKARRVGEQIAAGLTLDEILEDGIVLKYNTMRFKMKALNSWVNM